MGKRKHGKRMQAQPVSLSYGEAPDEDVLEVALRLGAEPMSLQLQSELLNSGEWRADDLDFLVKQHGAVFNQRRQSFIYHSPDLPPEVTIEFCKDRTLKAHFIFPG